MSPTRETDAPALRDHWWWRPGWAVGRRFYTWHVTWANAPDLHRLADTYQRQLRIPELDLIPQHGLHLTMQGIGFIDEVKGADVDQIVPAVQTRVRELQPFAVSFQRPVIHPEAVMVSPTPVEPLQDLRTAVRAGIADVWGADQVPEAADGWLPHVSLAYANATGTSTEPLAAALDSVDALPASATVNSVELIILGRDTHEYTWTIHANAPLAS